MALAPAARLYTHVSPLSDVDELPLDSRYVTLLKRWAGVSTVGDLTELCELEILRTIKIGPYGYEAIKRALAACGYELRKTTVQDKYRLSEPLPKVPVDSLKLPAELRTYLRKNGVQTLGRLAALPVESLEGILSPAGFCALERAVRPYRRQPCYAW